MSRKQTELEAGALNAWTPVQQAALYQHYLAKQLEQDDKNAAKEKRDEEKRAKRLNPESVQAGKVIDDLVCPLPDSESECTWGHLGDDLVQVKDRCPPLFTFLDLFGKPHIAIVPFVAAHFVFW